jgi:hypothetical protein
MIIKTNDQVIKPEILTENLMTLNIKSTIPILCLQAVVLFNVLPKFPFESFQKPTAQQQSFPCIINMKVFITIQ